MKDDFASPPRGPSPDTESVGRAPSEHPQGVDPSGDDALRPASGAEGAHEMSIEPPTAPLRANVGADETTAPRRDEAGNEILDYVPPAPLAERGHAPRVKLTTALRAWVHDYFLGDAPTFGLALVPYCFLSMLLFTRHPTTNFIFDEQEALLANPYVRSIADAEPKFRWVDAFYRDFWGLGPERSIGSYRPIPDLVWRALWAIGARNNPFLHHLVNVLLHGMNGALVCLIVYAVSKRRGLAWLTGAAFTASAVLTEAVSGVVGIADVLGATGALLAILALTRSMPWMALGVFAATMFGLYSKETALCCVPLVPLTALFTAQLLHPSSPRRLTRALLAFLATAAAFVIYVEARRRMFPAPIPAELGVEANADKPWASRTFAAILRWYAQPTLPRDPLNNPLVGTPGPIRVAGALRVYLRGLVQVVFPHTLSGDYSAPQEPAPLSPLFPESVLGGLAMLVPIPVAIWSGVAAYKRWRAEGRAETSRRGELLGAVGAVVACGSLLPVAILTTSIRWYIAAGALLVGGALFALGVRALRGERAEVARAYGLEPSASLQRIDVARGDGATPRDLRPLVGVGLLWIVLSYFPVSNIPVLLPTVRAERFWYFPVIGTCLLLGLAFEAILRRRSRRGLVIGGVLAFFLVQGVAARRHASDYADDLTFWDATRKAVPRSAKAHLNYSVMKGARHDLEARLESSRVALELAPDWAMASIYLGDTLCRLKRTDEAWPHYVHGFRLAPNDVNLVALALQCLWDEKALAPSTKIRAELDAMKGEYPGKWLEYLARDILEKGEEHGGVDPKYRPRGYNEGPKDQ